MSIDKNPKNKKRRIRRQKHSNTKGKLIMIIYFKRITNLNDQPNGYFLVFTKNIFNRVMILTELWLFCYTKFSAYLEQIYATLTQNKNTWGICNNVLLCCGDGMWGVRQLIKIRDTFTPILTCVKTRRTVIAGSFYGSSLEIVSCTL